MQKCKSNTLNNKEVNVTQPHFLLNILEVNSNKKMSSKKFKLFFLMKLYRMNSFGFVASPCIILASLHVVFILT